MLVLLLALVCKPFHFSLKALEVRANVLKARCNFFSGDTPRLVEIEEALLLSFLLTTFLLLLAEQGFHHGSSRLLVSHSLCVLS